MKTDESAAEWTAFVLKDNGGVRDDGHWHAEHCPGVPAIPCECIRIENEMSDYRMILDHCSTIYDIASGGRISKPNTLPREVESCMEERLQADIKEATKEVIDQRDRLAEALRERDEMVHGIVMCSCGNMISRCRCLKHGVTATRPHPACGKEALGGPSVEEIANLKAEVEQWRHLHDGLFDANMKHGEWRKEAEAEIASLKADRDRLAEALRPFIDDEPCRYDHDGDCQSHLVDQPCSMVIARAALTANTPEDGQVEPGRAYEALAGFALHGPTVENQAVLSGDRGGRPAHLADLRAEVQAAMERAAHELRLAQAEIASLKDVTAERDAAVKDRDIFADVILRIGAERDRLAEALRMVMTEGNELHWWLSHAPLKAAGTPYAEGLAVVLQRWTDTVAALTANTPEE